MSKGKKEVKQPQEHWQILVKTFFDFCEEKFGEKPSFDGSSPRDLTGIVESLKKRAVESQVIWTCDVAVLRFKSFLGYAYEDRWLRDNFILFNLNRHKDKVFFSIRKSIPLPAKPENKYQMELEKARAEFKPIQE